MDAGPWFSGLAVQLEAGADVTAHLRRPPGELPDVQGRQGGAGAVLELKVVDTRRGEKPEQALDRAMAQVRSRRYATELVAAGASPVWQWAAVFDGKRTWVRCEAGDASLA